MTCLFTDVGIIGFEQEIELISHLRSTYKFVQCGHTSLSPFIFPARDWAAVGRLSLVAQFNLAVSLLVIFLAFSTKVFSPGEGEICGYLSVFIAEKNNLF